MPEAPGRFSTNIAWPSVRDTPSAMSRAITSVAAPGPVGTISLIGRLGQVWLLKVSAFAPPLSAIIAQQSAMRKMPVTVCILAVGADVGMDFQERPHRLFRTGARHAAFGGDAEFRRVPPRRREPGPRAFDAVLGMNEAEKKLGALAECEIAERTMERVVVAFDRHRHMNIGEL